MRRSLLRSRSLPVTAAGRLRRIATTCVASFSGPPTMASLSWRRAVPTSSCSAPGMEDRGLAASTIDRRSSTVCGFYRFAHIDGRIRSSPAQYVRRPQVHASDARGLDRSELGVFLFTAEQSDRHHAALAVLLGLNGLRVSEACHQRRRPRPRARPSYAADRGQGQQARHRAARSTHRPDDRPGRRGTPRRPDPAAP
jgi:integrase